MGKGKHILILIFFTGLCSWRDLMPIGSWIHFWEQKGVFQTFFLLHICKDNGSEERVSRSIC